MWLVGDIRYTKWKARLVYIKFTAERRMLILGLTDCAFYLIFIKISKTEPRVINDKQ